MLKKRINITFRNNRNNYIIYKYNRMSNAWISHVKAYAKKHKCSYREAMSKAKASYKGGKGKKQTKKDKKDDKRIIELSLNLILISSTPRVKNKAKYINPLGTS